MSRRRHRWMLLVALGLTGGQAPEGTPISGRVLAQADAPGPSFRVAAKRVLPSVVSIRPAAVAPPVAPVPFPIIPPFANRPAPGGSGFVIDAAKGQILTNEHVLGDGSPVVVLLPDGRERPVARVDRDPKTDLALVTLADPTGLSAVEWGDSDAVEIGDWVLAIGQPFGLAGTASAGIISGKGRKIGLALYEDLIQTDAAINPGNSGGPLVDPQGRVIGITTAIKTAGGLFEGVGFAVPASRARRVAADLAAFGRVQRAYVGVNIRRVDPRAAERIGRADAALVYAVVSGGPAAQAGLRPGDIVIELGGRPVSASALQAAIEVAPVGEPITVRVDRDGSLIEFTVRPAAQPDQVEGLTAVPPPDGRLVGPGVVETTRTDAVIGLGMTISNGLVVTAVDEDGPADRAGIEPGMRITSVDGQVVATLEQLRPRLLTGDAVRVGVQRGGKTGSRVVVPDRATSTPTNPAEPPLLRP